MGQEYTTRFFSERDALADILLKCSTRSSMVSCMMPRKRRAPSVDIRWIQSWKECEFFPRLGLLYPTIWHTTQRIKSTHSQSRACFAYHWRRLSVCIHVNSLDWLDEQPLSYRITDAEAVSMSRYLVNDGLFLGSSSACNLFACVKLAKKMGWHNGERIVTILWVPAVLSPVVLLKFE